MGRPLMMMMIDTNTETQSKTSIKVRQSSHHTNSNMRRNKCFWMRKLCNRRLEILRTILESSRIWNDRLRGRSLRAWLCRKCLVLNSWHKAKKKYRQCYHRPNQLQWPWCKRIQATRTWFCFQTQRYQTLQGKFTLILAWTTKSQYKIAHLGRLLRIDAKSYWFGKKR